jgi:uncharacterized protein YchJ
MLTEYFDNEFDGVQYFNKNHIVDESWMQFYKNGDYRHGINGYIEYYSDLFKTDNKTLWKEYFDYAFDLKKIKIGRNDPCFCGSGKKYKNCCSGK